MEVQNFFLHLLLILLTARIFAELATRLLAEIGIILLLFEVGLGTDVRRLIHSGNKSMVVALSGFLLPLLLGLVLGMVVFDLSLLVALFVGGTLTATSIGITVRVLADLDRQQSSEGQVVLGAAVLDDILGVVLLAILYEFSLGGGVSLMNVGKVLVFIAAFFVLAPVAAKLISLVIRHFDGVSGLPGLIPTTIVSLVLFFAWLAHAMGAPQLLGGFAAGLALSRRFFLPFGVALHTDEAFAARIEAQMKPIIQLFTPIFFVVVGLSLNLHEIDWGSPFIWNFSLAMLVVAVVGKMVGPLFIQEPWSLRWMIGIAMVPRGEVGLIFAELGRVGGIFSNEVYAGLVIVIALTTLLPPFVMKGGYALMGERV